MLETHVPTSALGEYFSFHVTLRYHVHKSDRQKDRWTGQTHRQTEGQTNGRPAFLCPTQTSFAEDKKSAQRWGGTFSVPDPWTIFISQPPHIINSEHQISNFIQALSNQQDAFIRGNYQSQLNV